ncbi:MAG TPA: hypothetical protein VES42_19270 [Pilimelia sp.]|nr:hypothetical protein [Pilimelia sp.]
MRTADTPAGAQPATRLSPADFGYTGAVQLPDLWDQLTEPHTAVTFAMIVRARQHTRDPDLRAEARLAERALRAKFVEREGVIQSASFAERVIGGCALTERTERAGRREVIARRLHTVLNSAAPDLVALEAKCGTLAENAVTAYCGRPTLLRQLRTSTDSVFSVMTRVLRAANELAADPPPDRPRRAELLKIAADEYAHAHKQINAGIQREARFTYFQGTLLGAVATIAVCALVGFVSFRWWGATVSTPAFLASTLFGGIGAVTSVFQRMSTGRLVLDFTASRWQMITLGSVRPFAGAVFGAIVHFGLVGGVLGASISDAEASAVVGFSAVTGFAAGFSERLATDMIERAGKLVVGDAASTAEEDRAAEHTDRSQR